MLADEMALGQNAIGQNGTDKMVQTEWHRFHFIQIVQCYISL